MAFEATKKEWSEVYTFFKLLADGCVAAGTPEGKKGDVCRSIAMIQREEHDGTRQYYIEENSVRIEGENIKQEVLREDFGKIAHLILEGTRSAAEDQVVSPDGVEEFLDKIAIFNLQSQTNDRTDLHIAFDTPETPLAGFRVCSRMGAMPSLLDGGRAANLKFQLSGVKFAAPTVNKVNALNTPHEVADRMMLIERLGGVLKFADVADKVFRCNLAMIDLHFPRLLAEVLRIMHLDNITRVSELTGIVKASNPLKIKDELIQKHEFYEFKMKQFLLALALGMRPAKIYNGTDSSIEGFLLVSGNGDISYFHKSERKNFEDFLFLNTRFEKGATEKDKYGYLERENGVYYLKLNAKMSITKR